MENGLKMANPFDNLSDEQLAAALNQQQAGGLQFTGTTGRSARNNNPLNLEYRPGSYQDQYGATLEPTGGGKDAQPRFAKFPDMMSGYLAGLDQIRIDQARGHTLGSFVNKFAPPHENPTGDLIAQYSNYVGASPDTPLAQIPPEQLIIPMLARESSTRIVGVGTPALGNKPQQKNVFENLSDEDLFSALNSQTKPTPQPIPTPSVMPQEGVIADVPGMMPGQQVNQPNTVSEMVDPMAASMDMFSPAQAWEGAKIAGDIATQPGGPAHLPTLGMMAGGAVGGMTGGGLGAIPGAALGAGAGRAAQLFIKGQQGETLPSMPAQALDVGKSMLTGATAEMGGQVAGKVLEGAFAPGRKWLEKQIGNVEAYRAAQELANQGLPISPKTIAPSTPAKIVHWIAERFQPGKSIVDSYRKQSMDMIFEMRRNLVDDLGLPNMGVKPLGTAKEEIVQAFTKFREAIGPDAPVNMINTKTFLDNLQLTGKAEKDLDFVNVLKNRLQDGVLKVSDIEKVNATLWPKGKAYSRMSTAEKTWREDFLVSLFKDLEPLEAVNGMNMAAILKQAKGTTRDIYQSQFVEKLLDRATNNETLMFNPQQFYDIVKKQEAYILTKLDKDKAKNLFQFAERMKSIAPEKAMFTEGRLSPSLFEQGISSGIPLALGAGAVTKMPALAIPVGFQAIVARSLMNPKGIVRKWLTTGYQPPTLPVKIGLMEGMKND